MSDGKRGHGERFEMTGLELCAPNLYVPPILLREMEPGQVMAEPFDVPAGILHRAPAKFLKLQLDDTLLSENLLRPDRSAQPYTIKPAELKEGLHALKAIAQSPESEHLGVAVRRFVVDRLDSFRDVLRSHWARTAVEVLTDRGTLSGRGDGRFDPEEPHGAAPDRLKPLVSELLDAECSEALLVALGAGPPRRGEPARRPETLSAREVEVLALVAQGLNYGGRPGISRKRDTASPAVPLLPVIGITPWCFSEILQPGTERKRKSPPARAAKGEKTGPGSAIQAAQRLVWGACGRVRTVKCTVQAFQSGRSGHPAGVFFIIFPRWSTKKSRNTPPGRGFTHGRNLLIRHRLNLRPSMNLVVETDGSR